MQTSKILFIVAMNSELQPLVKSLKAVKLTKLLKVFPVFKARYRSKEVYTLQTFVGDTNASVATLEAIKYLDPAFVIKFGAVGGSYPQSKSGDIVVPLGFFHRTSWITRSKEGIPTSDSSCWQSVFGDLPHQVNSSNLGNLPYYFPFSKKLISLSLKSLEALGKKYVTAYIGGGNMWMFSKKILNNVANVMLPHEAKHRRFVSDMESYAIAHACFLKNKPFTGCYTVASNDYLDEPYDPAKVPAQMEYLVPYTLKLIGSL